MYARDKTTDFFEAIKTGNTKSLLDMLKQGYNRDYRLNDELRKNALIVAVESKNRVGLDLLLKSGAYVDAKDKNGMTAAMYAADRNYSKCLKDLEKYGANMNAVDNYGKNALMLAAMWDHLTCLQFLLSKVNDVNLRDMNGKTALMHAAIHGKDSCLRRLIDFRADLNIVDASGDTALMGALRHEEYVCANRLLTKGAKINVLNKDEMTALTLAFERHQGNFSMIERLLIQGADLTLTYKDQQYLHEMVARNQKKIVQLMIINGCPPFDKKCKEHWYSFSHHQVPISPLCVALLSGFDDIARYFMINKFYTAYDIHTLPNDPEIQVKLMDLGNEANGVLNVLALLRSGPQSLYTLSFVTISNIFNQTDRRERIEQSRLPKFHKDALLFNSAARICVLHWHDVPLTGQFYSTECQCDDCKKTKGIRPVIPSEIQLGLQQRNMNDLNVDNETRGCRPIMPLEAHPQPQQIWNDLNR